MKRVSKSQRDTKTDTIEIQHQKITTSEKDRPEFVRNQQENKELSTLKGNKTRHRIGGVLCIFALRSVTQVETMDVMFKLKPFKQHGIENQGMNVKYVHWVYNLSVLFFFIVDVSSGYFEQYLKTTEHNCVYIRLDVTG